MQPERKALLIIDMQKGSFTDDIPRYNASAVCDIINRLSRKFREKNWPVIHIQHDGSRDNEFLPGTQEWEILDEIEVMESDLMIAKTANDCFYKSQLEERINDLGIKDLLITGCATDFCVSSTIQSALTKEYNVAVVKDGHTTADRPELSAEQVINHYNWVWENMIPTRATICVTPYKEMEF